MNILHIETGRRLAGGPQQVLSLMQSLKARGVHSNLLCPDNSAVAERGRELGLSIQAVKYRGEHDVTFLSAIKKTVQQLSPDLIHVHSRRGADHYGALYARFSKIPVLLTRRVLNREGSINTSLKYKPYKKIVAVSEAVNRTLYYQDVAEHHRLVIHDGVQVNDFPLRNVDARTKVLAEFGLPEKAIIFASIGRFTENKMQEDAIKAFSIAATNSKYMHLILFGDGPMRKHLETLVAERNLSERVHFAGFRMDMPNWYAGLDTVIHTANLEALSVALLEAGASGLPVVAYDVGGIREVVMTGQTGSLVQHKNIRQLANAIEKLARKKELREQMGLNARERIMENFSAERMTDQYINLYQELITN